MESLLDITVRSSDIDLNGHLNHVRYVEFMERGRKAWYELIHFPLESFHSHGIMTSIVNINMNFRRECHEHDALQVVTKPVKVGRSSYVFDQTIINSDQLVCADARVTCVIMDLATRQSTSVPDKLRSHFPSE
ncbi:acyl-CoA thioesterase [Paenibacillus sp. GCM10027629]|uniref:acyl-CoA thioesterase n=1 Tax=Paenibacillus sp. GCM10027629 TaxID=3273414 RepID=UPI00363D9028